jgi:hypothetical protein
MIQVFEQQNKFYHYDLNYIINSIKKNPNDIYKLISVAIFEYNIDIDDLLKEINFDINTRYYWPSVFGIENTLLLSAIEYRNIPLIVKLLDTGADVNAKCADNYSIIDYLLWGHSSYDVNKPDECLEIYDIIKYYNPPLLIKKNTKDKFYNSQNWSLKTNKELCELINSCAIIDDKNIKDIYSYSVTKLIINELVKDEPNTELINELTSKLKKDTSEHYLFWNYVRKSVMNRLEEKLDLIISKYE